MSQEKFANLLLQNLNAGVIERLDLRPVQLELRRVLEQAGSRIDQVYFIEQGIGSMTTNFCDGSQVECGMFGRESLIGAEALMGMRRAANQIVVQVSGHGFATTTEAAEREFRRCEDFHDLATRFVLSQSIQASQTAGCNARHNVQQRLSRWLLQVCDRVNEDVFNLTQEFMAAMLGVERPAVSVVAVKLQERGMIEYSRGRLRLTDRKGLEGVACECYWVVKKEMEEFTAFAQARGGRQHS